MDLTALKNFRPSLTDFLGNGKAGHFQDVSSQLLDTINKKYAGSASSEEAATSVNVTLSAEAQSLLESGTGGTESNMSGLQKGAQNFLMSFFDDSGLELSKLSDDVLGLIQGLQDVITSSTATGRDFSTDTAEEKYANGSKKVYTLAGNGTRLRLAIEYTDEKPQKLSITDITGGAVDTAEVLLQPDNGTSGTMTINRSQREYVNGHMTSLSNSDPIEVDLYK